MDSTVLLWWTIASMATILVALVASGTLAIFKTTPFMNLRKKCRKKDGKDAKGLTFNQWTRVTIMKERAKRQIVEKLAENKNKKGFFGSICIFFYRIFVHILVSLVAPRDKTVEKSKRTLIDICREEKRKSYEAILDEVKNLNLEGAGKRKKLLFNPYQILLGGFFLAVMLIFVPVLYFDTFKLQDSGIKEVKTILLSIVNTIKVFVVDSDYGQLIDTVETLVDKNIVAYKIYSTYAVAIHALGPIMVAGFVLSFFKEAISIFRLRFHRRRKYIYIMSELNARSLALAEDIIGDRSVPKYQKLIVFTDVFEKDDDRVHEQIEKARHLGALCVKRDITGINLKYMAKDKYRKLYFLSENEEKNIKQALKMIQNATYNERCNVDKTELYVFAVTIESEALIDSINKRSVKVRRINENKNLVYKAMLDYPIFNDTLAQPCNDAIAEIGLEGLERKLDKKKKAQAEGKDESQSLKNDIEALESRIECAKDEINSIKEKISKQEQANEKELNIAIIGLGGYGTELLKTICWLGQAEGYHINIHAFECGNGKAKIKFIAPELIEYNHKSVEGNSSYDIYFYDNKDVTKAEFFEQLSTIEDLTSVYVTLGDDELNIQTAMRVRSYLGRKSRVNSFIPIYAVVFSQVKTDLLSSGSGLMTADEEKYKITFIGSLKDLCNLETIEQRTNEPIARNGHLYWSEFYDGIYGTIDEKSRKKNIDNFEKYEYYRKSSLAQAVFYRILNKAKVKQSRDKIGKHEHARWNVFMRSEGFVLGDKKHFVKKTHQELVDFEKLPSLEKEKDLFYDSQLGYLIIGNSNKNGEENKESK